VTCLKALRAEQSKSLVLRCDDVVHQCPDTVICDFYRVAGSDRDRICGAPGRDGITRSECESFGEVGDDLAGAEKHLFRRRRLSCFAVDTVYISILSGLMSVSIHGPHGADVLNALRAVRPC